MKKLIHKTEGWIFDITRNRLDKIKSIHSYTNEKKHTIYCLVFYDSFTRYLTVDELNELYPYIGENINTIKILYGSEV